MNNNIKKDFNRLMENQIESILQSNLEKRPSLLLHACCAPCSSAVLEKLTKYFEIAIFYYNPNIHPESEYIRRRDELKDFISNFSIAKNIKIIIDSYNPEEYFIATNVRHEIELQTEKERGERCFRCYKFRMEKAFEYAIKNKFEYVTTTLSISPHKDASKINFIGAELEKLNKSETKFLYSDFKKKNGFKRSLEISSEFGLYRQDYCGCIFSKI